MIATIASLLCAYLLNALWQLPLLFGAAWLSARLLRGHGPALEHRVWVGTLLLSVVLPACSFGDSMTLNWHALLRSLSSASHHGTVTVVTGTFTPVEPHTPRITAIGLFAIAGSWVLAVSFFAVRLAWRMSRTFALGREARLITPTGATNAIWQRCSQLFAVSDAQLAESSVIFGPVTLGVRRRTLLLPIGWSTDLPAAELEAAFAHEFAHMQRRDFAKNFVLEVLALPIAWHPLLPLFRAHLAESREMLCDTLAAKKLHGRNAYARNLLRMASLLATGMPSRTLHALGIFDSSIFERRLMNLTQPSPEIRGVRRVATTALCAVLALGVCTSALALHLSTPASPPQNSAPIPPPPPPPSPRVTSVRFAESAQRVDAVRFPDPVASSAPQSSTSPQNLTRLSSDVVAGARLSGSLPVYPNIARAAKVEGAVLLHAVVGEDGNVKRLQALSGPEILKGAAIEAVKDWKYKPFLVDGQPTAVDTTITVNFSLQD